MNSASLQLKGNGKGDALTKYDPAKGLKTIAVAEAAEKHYARAKDATMLFTAIEAKLTAQAEFVAWWDSQKLKGRPTKKVNGSVKLSGINVEAMVLSRWRKKLSDPVKFETELEKAQARCIKIIEAQQQSANGAHVGHNSGEHEWYTPTEYIEAARAVLGEIDLDPASSDTANTIVKAAQIFTFKDNGLEQPWHGRVWMNPPYSQPAVEHFAQKFANSVESGDVTAAVVLVNNATETAWFHTLAGAAKAICFPRGRVKFWSPNQESATPLQGQALLYAGPKVDKFIDGFGPFGLVAKIARRT